MNLEAALILESLALKRTARLEDIAVSEMMRLDREKFLGANDLIRLKKENLLDDLEINAHFNDRYIPEARELHTRNCEDSGIPQCICLEPVGVGGSVVL